MYTSHTASSSASPSPVQASSPLLQLPQPIVSEVLQFLSAEDLMSVCNTCKLLLKLGREESLWQRIARKNFLQPPSTTQTYFDVCRVFLSIERVSSSLTLKRVFTSLLTFTELSDSDCNLMQKKRVRRKAIGDCRKSIFARKGALLGTCLCSEFAFH